MHIFLKSGTLKYVNTFFEKCFRRREETMKTPEQKLFIYPIGNGYG